MAHSSWGSGWPNCQSGKIKGLVRGDGLKLQLREELIPLFALLLDETERQGYDVRRFIGNNVPVTGGFNCRDIKDKHGNSTGKPSNHSWGLAIDINSDTNPRQAPMKRDIPDGVVALWERYGFRWGGRFSPPDPMHFEYMGSTGDVAGHTAKASAELGGGAPPPSNVTAPATGGGGGGGFPGVVLKRGASGAHVCKVQARLRELGHNIDVRPGCPFGPQTDAAVRAFQGGNGLTVDGKVGKNTWKALFG